MTPYEFERFAQERMSEHLGLPLKKKAPGGFPKIFDLVSDDDGVVGDAKYLTLVDRKYEPPAKLMEITGHVWLLEKLAARQRFLVFGNQVEVPEMWLQKYGRLPTTVEFYFLEPNGRVIVLRRAPKPSRDDELHGRSERRYYLYVNHANDRARVHREGCRFIRVHGGTHSYDEGYWREYPTREAAFGALAGAGKRDATACGRCNP